jgi:hypothetical protein
MTDEREKWRANKLSQPLDADPTHLYVPVLFRPIEGRIAIVTDVGRNAVDASVSSDVRHGLRTAKACGPGTPGLVPSVQVMICTRR